MFVIPAIALLYTFVYIRPHEIFAAAAPLSINLVMVLLALAFVLDLKVRAIRLRGSPLLVVMVLLFVWCLLTTAIKAPDRLNEQMIRLIVAAAAFLALSEGPQTFRALGVASGLLVAITLGLAVAGTHQGFSSPVCHVIQGEVTPLGLMDVSDGRPCEKRGECYEGGVRDREYTCERPGILGTHSIGGRVRFRGLLEDPNALSWAIAMGAPLAFALFERRKNLFRLLVLLAMVGLSFVCVIKTQSRSGQIAMMGMTAVYFVRRFGWKGIAAGAVTAIPLLIFGGRSTDEASASSYTRLECWAAAFDMWRETPLMGVGSGQFLEYYHQTAHSSFMLTFAELGPAGLVLWSAAIYLAFKIPIRVQIELAGREDAAVARTWATALLASQVGLLVSVFFLTLAYHPILWIFIGLSAALYAAVREHEPNFRVRFGWKDLLLVSAIDGALVVATAIYLRIKGVY